MNVRPGARVPVPDSLPTVVLARDYLHGEVVRRARAGQVLRVGRGGYLPAGDHLPRPLALAQVVAAHGRLVAPHCFSHESAAMIWGLPLWQLPSAVHVRTRTRAGAGCDQSVRRHHGIVPPELTTRVNGLPVTTLALTVVDCAGTLPALDALVVLDAALRAGLRREDVTALLDALAGRRGTRRARLLLAHADPGAESAWETATRFHLLRAGLPTPVTQVRVDAGGHTYWADLGIPQWRLLIEYDGRDKYTSADVVFAEKLRQDAITTDQRMIRVTSQTRPAHLVAKALTYAPPTWRPVPRPELNA